MKEKIDPTKYGQETLSPLGLNYFFRLHDNEDVHHLLVYFIRSRKGVYLTLFCSVKKSSNPAID